MNDWISADIVFVYLCIAFAAGFVAALLLASPLVLLFRRLRSRLSAWRYLRDIKFNTKE